MKGKIEKRSEDKILEREEKEGKGRENKGEEEERRHR